jgi:hypothetical protein
MKITKQQLRQLILDNINESSYHRAAHDHAAHSKETVLALIMAGIEELANQKGVMISGADIEEYKYDIRPLLSRELVQSIGDIFSEIMFPDPHLRQGH